jgi:zinc transport system permease protein
MLDDFFIRALIAGTGVAIVAGPLGCFVVWRRLAYLGDTLGHSALLGVSLGLLFQISIFFSVFAVAAAVSLSLLVLQRRGLLASDALLGLLSHGALAAGLVLLAVMSWVRFDVTALLFGDILAVSRADIVVVYAAGASVLAVLAMIWHPLFAATVSPELARAEDLRPERANAIFMLLMAVMVAIAMKVVGVLLITALLIIPASAARQFASGPEQMAAGAALLGVASVIGGLFGSLQWDLPSGPAIVVAALAIFFASLLAPNRRPTRSIAPPRRTEG